MHIYIFTAFLKKGFPRGGAQQYRTTVKAANAREAVKLGKDEFRKVFDANPFAAYATKRIEEWMPMPLPGVFEWQPIRYIVGSGCFYELDD